MGESHPIPVVVVIARVDGGILGIRRGIQPGKGKLALPGGYMDYGETVEEAVAREFHEETGVMIPSGSFVPFYVKSSSDRSKVLIFMELVYDIGGLPVFVPNDEVTELVVLRGDEELAFPEQTVVVHDFFKRGRGRRS